MNRTECEDTHSLLAAIDASVSQAKTSLESVRLIYLECLEVTRSLSAMLGTPESLRDIVAVLNKLAAVENALGNRHTREPPPCERQFGQRAIGDRHLTRPRQKDSTTLHWLSRSVRGNCACPRLPELVTAARGPRARRGGLKSGAQTRLSRVDQDGQKRKMKRKEERG